MTGSVNYATGEIAETLTALEGSALSHAELTIEQGLKTFVEVGQALAEIRDSRLYRADHSTFEDYCQQRWGMDRRNANRTIEAAEVVAGLGSIDPSAPKPINLGQARELSGMEPHPAAKTMREAHRATAGNVTAKAIREARISVVENLSDKYVTAFPALGFYRAKGDHERVNALGRDLEAMDDAEREYRLGILRKSIAAEQRRDRGERPSHLSVVDADTEPSDPEVEASPPVLHYNPDADDMVTAARRIRSLMNTVATTEVAESDQALLADVGAMLTDFADRMKES